MKKIITLSFLVFLSFSTFSQESVSAVSAGVGSFIVKVTPVTVLRNMWFTVHGEYAISPSVSLALGISPNAAPKANFLDDIDNNTGNYCYEWDIDNAKAGFSIDPEFRWYSDGMMDGFFFGAYSSLRFGSSSFEELSGEELFDPFTGESFGLTYCDTPTGKKLDMKTMVVLAGPQFGWEKLLGKQDKFVFDGYLGIGAKITNRTYSGNVEGPGYANSAVLGLGVRGNVSVGYRIK
jgi:hypothetical protein